MIGSGVNSRSRALGGMNGRKLAEDRILGSGADDVGHFVRRIARVDRDRRLFFHGLTRNGIAPVNYGCDLAPRAESIALNACSGRARTAMFSVRFTHRTIPFPIDVEFRRARDVFVFRSGMWMEQIIAPNRRRVRIRQERKGVAHSLRMTLIDLDRIDTDRHHLDAAGGEIAEPLLKTPQLGVTEQSPVSTVKDQDDAVW